VSLAHGHLEVLSPINSATVRKSTPRERFLELKAEEDFLDFLTQTGHFSASLARAKKGIWGKDAFRCWQKVFRQMLNRSPEKWNDYMQRLTVPAGFRHSPDDAGFERSV